MEGGCVECQSCVHFGSRLAPQHLTPSLPQPGQMLGLQNPIVGARVFFEPGGKANGYFIGVFFIFSLATYCCRSPYSAASLKSYCLLWEGGGIQHECLFFCGMALFGAVQLSLFVVGAIFGDVGLSLFVAGPIFGEVQQSLFVAGAKFGDFPGRCNFW